jgi:hypothetical protein
MLCHPGLKPWKQWEDLFAAGLAELHAGREASPGWWWLPVRADEDDWL